MVSVEQSSAFTVSVRGAWAGPGFGLGSEKCLCPLDGAVQSQLWKLLASLLAGRHRAYDQKGAQHGCSGALAKQCTAAYPGSVVTIFDLSKVVHMAKEHFVSAEDDRILFHEGDFFKDPLPEADLYILARILHDWTDQRSLELLTKVQQSCKQGGGVLLVEALLDEDNSGPLTAQLYSLNMLVQTEGRERKASEYAALLTAAGFTHVQVQRTGKIYDAVLARK
ncbi:hypothetical protein JZ751_027799 [Albula glossodonta]|uniref:Acetylserotonin O-methyltransferase n=1 Tax=Albula glossodonta TaxID=121402 RepID=A0A8T2PC91_9TELE|nr:hypothetical protein JZ751_027799 [Albula glossodonta]